MSDRDVLFAISSSASPSGATTAATTTTTAAAAAPGKSQHHHKHHPHHHHRDHHHHKSSHGKTMAPTPDNDPGSNNNNGAVNKAPPDKGAKGNRGEAPKDDKVSVPRTVDDLNDGELRALLDEAANYKNPKDREGKSKLFNHLLMEAEETERNARASRAGGSELVRYHNPSAARRGTRHRNKKRSSVSENMMHGGSLDNLAKETLYETSKSRGGKKSVSARQREGGSLPCNVNAPNAIKVECVDFLEEEARRRKIRNEPTMQQAAIVTVPAKNEYYTSSQNSASFVVDMEPECFTFMNHDVVDKQQQLLMNSINHHHQQQFTSTTTMPIEIVHYPVAQHAKFTILPVSPDGGGGCGGAGPKSNNSNVDDAIQLGPLEFYTTSRTKSIQLSSSSNNNNNNNSSSSTALEEIEEHKKVDENDNEKDKEGKEGEDGQGEDADKAKEEADKKKDKDKEKKKKTGERNVTVCTSQELKGYNPKIANSDVKAILEYVGEPSNISDKDLRINPHPFKPCKLRNSCEDNSAVGKKGNNNNKKRNKDHTNSSAGDKLKKSNSMGEISSSAFDDDDEEDVVVLRNKSVDRRERRSWGEMQSPAPSLIQHQNLSAENLETADFHVVTKKKNKQRKRRSSLGTSGVDSSSGAHSAGSRHHNHNQQQQQQHQHLGQQRDCSGRKSSEDGHSYSQSGSSYATSSVSEGGGRSGKPTAARSAPQSDKSDSCSDADSVHSLPISAVAAHEISEPEVVAIATDPISAEVATAAAATKAKVLSYADMARNGDASCRTKQQQRTSFGTKIMTNYAKTGGGGVGGAVIVDNNANSVYNLNNINSNINISNNSKVQPKVERRKSLEAPPAPPQANQGGEEDEMKEKQQQQEEKQEPPDVTSIKSFPAIKSPLEKNHGQSSGVSSNFSGNNSNSSSSSSNKGKTQKIDASTNTGQMNAWNNNRGVSAISAAASDSSSSGTGGLFENVSGNYAVFNKLPPDIQDVQTIEKMQLLSQGHPYEESELSTSAADCTPLPSITSNSTGASSAIVTSTPKITPTTNDCSLDCDISERRTLKNNNNINNNNNKVGVTAADAAGDCNVDASSVRDDSSSGGRRYEDRNLIINESGLEHFEIGESDETSRAEEAYLRQQQQQQQLLEERPPVVILSGGEPKEISGLVFGFDINEQLLNEGRSLTVEEFTASFVFPRNYTRTSHNHADIAKFIADGWKNFSASNDVEEYSPDKL